MPYLDNGGTRLHYEVFGAGPPLVLLHGSLMDARSWELAGYIEALREDYLLVTVDCRGAGESDKPLDPGNYTMDAYASDVIAVADEIGISDFVVWGFSWGGSIAWGVAEMHPDRVRALIVSGCYTRDHLIDRDFVETNRVRPLRELGSGGFYDLAEPFEGPLPEWFRDQFTSTDADAYIAARHGAYTWSPLDAAKVAAPTLLLSGELEDPDRTSEEVAAAMPHGRAEVLDGLSHCRAFVASDITVPLVRNFLSEVL
jgi:pimeloyl-ACP methyl ester carboxylesterase